MRIPVKEFVQDRLGCQCPDEVFEIIERTDDFIAADGTVIKVRINIGNRLLVYVADIAEHLSAAWIGNLLKLGLDERQALGFNRFRLALIAPDHAAALRELRTIDQLADGEGSSLQRADGFFDEKVHAHIINGDDF